MVEISENSLLRETALTEEYRVNCAIAGLLDVLQKPGNLEQHDIEI
ncbi:hypothetical protein [Leptolyngbya sp. FACHB-711]|nr:hypothetical protein [Leptolyngbya sp. FACHB-711]MBD1850585.1 hypothetical protein [Cyanobacteria bacterium FACHB-502]MBD2023947.1 hypothetical protein [Leptolyngbya sp. FACHB-711]